jgi:hypothetical protein
VVALVVVVDQTPVAAAGGRVVIVNLQAKL